MIYQSNYINQQFPNAQYSEIKYLQSNAGIALIQLDQNLAIAVLTHYIYWVAAEAGTTIITFKDQHGNPLFSQLSTLNCSGSWAPIFQVKRGATLKVSCSNITIKFSVSFQYLMRPGTKVEEDK